MTATNHVVTGMLVATFINNPLIALPVALASHFALDAIPHFGFPTISKKFVIFYSADIGFAASILAATLLLQPAGVWLLLVCGITAASPDLMWLHYLVVKREQFNKKWPAIVRFHSKIQTERLRYIVVEAAWLLIFGSLLVSRLY